MKLLLDTHIWLWSFLQPERLSRRVAEELEGSSNELWLSSISVWETLILAEKGRIELRPSPEEWIEDALREVPMHDAPMSRQVAIESRRVSLATGDPADRFIAGTARVYELTLVTADPALAAVEGLTVMDNGAGRRG